MAALSSATSANVTRRSSPTARCSSPARPKRNREVALLRRPEQARVSWRFRSARLREEASRLGGSPRRRDASVANTSSPLSETTATARAQWPDGFAGRGRSSKHAHPATWADAPRRRLSIAVVCLTKRLCRGLTPLGFGDDGADLHSSSAAANRGLDGVLPAGSPRVLDESEKAPAGWYREPGVSRAGVVFCGVCWLVG